MVIYDDRDPCSPLCWDTAVFVHPILKYRRDYVFYLCRSIGLSLLLAFISLLVPACICGWSNLFTVFANDVILSFSFFLHSCVAYYAYHVRTGEIFILTCSSDVTFYFVCLWFCSNNGRYFCTRALSMYARLWREHHEGRDIFLLCPSWTTALLYEWVRIFCSLLMGGIVANSS